MHKCSRCIKYAKYAKYAKTHNWSFTHLFLTYVFRSWYMKNCGAFGSIFSLALHKQLGLTAMTLSCPSKPTLLLGPSFKYNTRSSRWFEKRSRRLLSENSIRNPPTCGVFIRKALTRILFPRQHKMFSGFRLNRYPWSFILQTRSYFKLVMSDRGGSSALPRHFISELSTSNGEPLHHSLLE